MPPFGLEVLNQPVLPLSEEGVKQILWSPASCAVKVKRPPEPPFCVTMRWLLSKSSCSRHVRYHHRQGPCKQRLVVHATGDVHQR